jgi:hypothetical protein
MAFRFRVHAPTGIAFQRVGAAPLEPIDHHVSDPMPQRGIAYQPRVPTLGLHPEKQTRVLKERRIAACLGPRPRPTLCGVPSEHPSRVKQGLLVKAWESTTH